MRQSSKCKLGKQCKKKIDHYFQNKKTYLRWGGSWLKGMYLLNLQGSSFRYCFVILFCEWALLDGSIAPYFCSCMAERHRKLAAAAKAKEPSICPVTLGTTLTGVDSLLCVRAQAVLYEIAVHVGIRAAQRTAHTGSSSTSQALRE